MKVKIIILTILGSLGFALPAFSSDCEGLCQENETECTEAKNKGYVCDFNSDKCINACKKHGVADVLIVTPQNRKKSCGSKGLLVHPTPDCSLIEYRQPRELEI